MAFIQYLNFDGTDIPLPDSYDVEVSDVVSDAGGETEAGTTQRDVIRSGVIGIPVSFNVSPAWLKKLSEYRKEAKIKVKFFNPYTLEAEERDMYIDGFKTSLVKDTSYKGLWKVSFTLKEF